MALEKYFPFRSVAGDRKYSAEDWAAYFAQFLSDGVFYNNANNLKVVANDAMKVTVNTGAGFVLGRMYVLEREKVLTIETADGVLDRIDRIVLRCDYINRLMGVDVIKGNYSAKPTAPELTRNADVYELALADVYVSAGAIEIIDANIADQRLNTSLCGIVTGLVEQADTTEIFNQFQAYLEEFKETSQADFEYWFNNVKAVLDKDATGNLITLIDREEAARKKEIAVERARVDALVKMDEGSTTGDAELQDMRVGEDGEKYETAGTAVRQQFRKQRERIEDVSVSHIELKESLFLSTEKTNVGVDNGTIGLTWGCHFEQDVTDIKVIPEFSTDDNSLEYTWKLCKTTDGTPLTPETSTVELVATGVGKVGKGVLFIGINSSYCVFFEPPNGHTVKFNEERRANYSCGLMYASSNYAITHFTDKCLAGTFWYLDKSKPKYALNETVEKRFDDMEKIYSERFDSIEKIYSGKTWCVLGDSITEKNSTATTSYYDYIAEETGITVLNKGVSGTGYKYKPTGADTFYERILTLNDKDFDILTIFGSGNDSGYFGSGLGTATDTGTDTLGGCINTAIDNFYTVAPFKKIALITPTPWERFPLSNVGNGMEKLSNLICDIAKRRGIPCLDLYHTSGLRPWDEDFRVEYYNENGVQDEGVHPNSKGHKYFYPLIREFIKTLL